MPETSIAWDIAEHLVATISDAPAATGVLVTEGWPGEQGMEREMLWIDDITSDQTIPTSTGGRTHRDDIVTIRFLSRVVGRDSYRATAVRIKELGALIENPTADSPTLDDFDGIVSAEITSTALKVSRTPGDFIGWGQHVLTIHTRLT